MEAKFRTDKRQNGNCDTADNFVTPNTADFEMQTSHTVTFKNTATPQAEILFTATRHEKMRNTATPQIPNVPLCKTTQILKGAILLFAVHRRMLLFRGMCRYQLHGLLSCPSMVKSTQDSSFSTPHHQS